MRDLEVSETADGVEFALKAVPGASRTAIAGLWGTRLKVAVSAPPEGGKANAAIVKFLAACLGVHAADIEIVQGHGQPLKRVRVSGLDEAALRERLSKQR